MQFDPLKRGRMWGGRGSGRRRFTRLKAKQVLNTTKSACHCPFGVRAEGAGTKTSGRNESKQQYD